MTCRSEMIFACMVRCCFLGCFQWLAMLVFLCVKMFHIDSTRTQYFPSWANRDGQASVREVDVFPPCHSCWSTHTQIRWCLFGCEKSCVYSCYLTHELWSLISLCGVPKHLVVAQRATDWNGLLSIVTHDGKIRCCLLVRLSASFTEGSDTNASASPRRLEEKLETRDRRRWLERQG